MDLRLVTTVSGNAPASVCAANARRLLDLAGRGDVRVVAGADRAVPDAVVHGADGLLGLDLPPPSRPPDGDDPAAALAAFAGVLVAIGPLTNIAATLRRGGGRWRRLVLMGGALGPGNTRSGAEYNFAADPAAAAAVLAAGLHPVLVPLDLARTALATPQRIAALAAASRIGARLAPMLAAYADQDRRHHGLAGAMVADVHAVALLDRPHLYRRRRVRLEVDPAGRCRETTTAPVLELAETVAAEHLFALITARLARLPVSA